MRPFHYKHVNPLVANMSQETLCHAWLASVKSQITRIENTLARRFDEKRT